MLDVTGVMMQCFHWYLPNDGSLWAQVRESAAELASAGFSAVWLPPAFKGHVGGYDVGYGVYDMYDLGEFDQKGSVRTKYGTRSEYLSAIKALHAHDLHVYADVVWNHRLGADESEVVMATPYSALDRSRPSGPTREVEVWTKFNFVGRGGVYDLAQLDSQDFTAVDYDQRRPDEYDTIYLFQGKSFDEHVAGDYGNFAYLMGCDVDHSSPNVREGLVRWGRWYLDTTNVDGLRLDAVKHIPSWALALYIDALRAHCGRELPVVAEYWTNNLPILLEFLQAVGDRMMLFDVPLHFNLHRASRIGNSFDLRSVFDQTIVATRPEFAVTFVDNHDSQPLQALESTVADWFKPHAYALLLLREAGFPCVFSADYYGASYTEIRGDGSVDIRIPSLRPFIEACMRLRRELGSAGQTDYFDHPNVVGWVRRGVSGLLVVVLLSNGDRGIKNMSVGEVGRKFRDLVGNVAGEIVSDSQGFLLATCAAGSVSVWVSYPMD